MSDDASQKAGFRILPSLILLLLSLIAVIGIPYLDRFLIGSKDAPGLFTYIGTGAALTAFTAALFTIGLHPRLGAIKNLALFAFAYNALIVLVKFTLAPLNLYLFNSARPFLVEEYSRSSFSFITPLLVAFLLYAGVLYTIYRLFRSKLPTPKHSEDDQALREYKAKTRNRLITVTVVGLVLVFLVGGSTLYFLLFAFFFASSGKGGDGNLSYYLNSIFSTGAGYLILLMLVLAIVAAVMTFKHVTDAAKIAQKTSIMTSFFGSMLALLVVYHSLWVVYILMIGTFWPLKIETFSTGGK